MSHSVITKTTRTMPKEICATVLKRSIFNSSHEKNQLLLVLFLQYENVGPCCDLKLTCACHRH